MSKPLIHAQSSAKKFGGVWTDYMPIHEILDSSKAVMADNRHRALTHNSWFISTILPRIFGETFMRQSDGVFVSVRDIAEQHVLEDYRNRFIPSASDFLNKIPFEDWMQNGNSGCPDSYEALKKNNEKAKTVEIDENFVNRPANLRPPGSMLVD